MSMLGYAFPVYGRQWQEEQERRKKSAKKRKLTAPLKRELSICESELRSQSEEISRLTKELDELPKEDVCQACNCIKVVYKNHFKDGNGKWNGLEICEKCCEGEVLENCDDCYCILSKITDEVVETDEFICHESCTLDCEECRWKKERNERSG